MANATDHGHRALNGDFWSAHQFDCRAGLCSCALADALRLLAATRALAAGSLSIVNVSSLGLWRVCRLCRTSATRLYYGDGGVVMALALSIVKRVDSLFGCIVFGSSA